MTFKRNLLLWAAMLFMALLPFAPAIKNATITAVRNGLTYTVYGSASLSEGETLNNSPKDGLTQEAQKDNPLTGVTSDTGYGIAFLFILVAAYLLRPFFPFKRVKNLFKGKTTPQDE